MKSVLHRINSTRRSSNTTTTSPNEVFNQTKVEVFKIETQLVKFIESCKQWSEFIEGTSSNCSKQNFEDVELMNGIKIVQGNLQQRIVILNELVDVVNKKVQFLRSLKEKCDELEVLRLKLQRSLKKVSTIDSASKSFAQTNEKKEKRQAMYDTLYRSINLTFEFIFNEINNISGSGAQLSFIKQELALWKQSQLSLFGESADNNGSVVLTIQGIWNSFQTRYQEIEAFEFVTEKLGACKISFNSGLMLKGQNEASPPGPALIPGDSLSSTQISDDEDEEDDGSGESASGLGAPPPPPPVKVAMTPPKFNLNTTITPPPPIERPPKNPINSTKPEKDQVVSNQAQVISEKMKTIKSEPLALTQQAKPIVIKQNVNDSIQPLKPPALPKRPSTIIAKAQIVKAYIAEDDFTAQQEGDLTFSKGDKLEFVRNYDDNWMVAKDKGGVEGLVPTSFLRLLN